MNKTQLTNQLLEQSKDLFWMINTDFQLIYANNKYLDSVEVLTGNKPTLYTSAFETSFGEKYIEKWKGYYQRGLQGECFDIEDHYYNPQSNEIQHALISFATMRRDDNEIFGVSCQSKDITTEVRQRSEANELIDASLDVFCTINEEGNFVYVSAASENHWGYLPSELIGKAYLDFTLEEDVAKTQVIAADILSGQEIRTFVNRYTKKNGGVAYNYWSAKWNEATKLMYCVARDGKEKIEQEDIILQSEKHFKALVQESSDLIGILDADGKYKYISPLSNTILGMEPEVFIGKSPIDFTHPDDVDRTLSSLKKITSEKKVVVKPFRFHNYKKEWRWVETVLTNMLEKPVVNGIVASLRDVTEKIENEERILQSEQRFKALVQEGSDLIGILDLEGNYKYVSPSSLSVLGIAPEEFIGRNATEFIHPEDVERTLACLQSINTENRVVINPFRFQNGAKEWRWVETVLTNMLDNPAVNGIVSNSRDITDNIEQKEKILYSEQRFKALVQEGSDVVVIMDAEGNYKYISPSSISVLGFPPEEFLGKNATDFIHPDDVDKALESLQKLTTQHRVKLEPFRFQNQHKEWRWFETVLTNMMDNPVVEGIVANSRDITDTVNARLQMEANELFNRTVLESSPDCLKVIDSEGRLKFMNSNGLCQMEIDDFSSFLNKKWYSLWGDENEELIQTSLEKALTGNTVQFTAFCPTAKGTPKWWDVMVSPIRRSGEKVQQIISVSRDVTWQKNQELQKELLNKIIAIFNQSNDKDLKNCLLSLCQEIAHFGDFDSAEVWLPAIDGKTINLVSFYSTIREVNNFKKVSENIKFCTRGEGMPGYVWENKKTEIWGLEEGRWFGQRREAARKDGVESLLGIPLSDKDEIVAVLVLSSRKTKAALVPHSDLLQKLESTIAGELSRKKMEIELAQIFDFTPDMICVAGFDGYLKRINPAGLELLGYSLEEMLSRPIVSFIHEDDRIVTKESQQYVYGGGKLRNHENRYITKQGKVVWLSWTAKSASELGIVYAVAKDVTFKKKYLQLLDDAANLARIGSWEIDLVNQTVYWSTLNYEIHEMKEGFLPDIKKPLGNFEESYQAKFQVLLEECMVSGTFFDFEAPIITSNGKRIWTRTIGKTEFIEGVCVRIYGSFQDIDQKVQAAEKLQKAYEEKNNILDSIGDAFFTVDKNWMVTYWNREAENVLGRNKELIIGRNLWEEYPEAVDSDFYREYHKAVKTGKANYFEAKYATLNMWVEVSVYPTEEGVSVYFKDITLRKEADIRLMEANERFEKATEATNDVIWDWDIVNQTYHRSKAIERFFGKGATRSFKENDFWKEHFHPEDLVKIQDTIYEAFSDSGTSRWELEYRVLNEQGTTLYVIDRGIIIRNAEGKAIRMVGAMTDITEQKQMTVQLSTLNSSLQQHTLELERSNEELEQFAFVASHDLQEPLRMISSFMDLLQRKYGDLLDEKAHRYIYFATDGAKRMKQIILDLLEYSRTSRPTEGKEMVDLNVMLSEFKQLRRKIIHEKKAVFVSENLPVLTTYKASITQILHCLLDNTLKYTVEGKAPKIYFVAVENESEWEFSIHDNGIGIDPQFFNKIFIIFQRLHNNDQYPGTGIGLSIAKRHIEFLGGRIWLESVPGEGTKFYFTIPKCIQNES